MAPACNECPNGSKLRAFKEWVDRTEAKEVDPIWIRGLYEATKEG